MLRKRNGHVHIGKSASLSHRILACQLKIKNKPSNMKLKIPESKSNSKSISSLPLSFLVCLCVSEREKCISKCKERIKSHQTGNFLIIKEENEVMKQYMD